MNATIYTCQKRITAAQIIAGSVTPITLVEKQGPGTIIVPTGIITWVLLAGSTAFSAAADLNIGNTVSSTLWQAGVTVPLDVATDAAESNPAGMAATVGFANFTNLSLLATFSAAVTGGNSVLDVIFNYSIITIPYPW